MLRSTHPNYVYKDVLHFWASLNSVSGPDPVGSASFWPFRIRMDPYHYADPVPDPDT